VLALENRLEGYTLGRGIELEKVVEDGMKTPGPQNLGANRTIRKRQKKSLLLLGGLLLGSRLLSSLLLRGHDGVPP